MNLQHFSDKKDLCLDALQNARYERESGELKPKRGFWVSDEADHGWYQWCIDERFRLDKLKYAYLVELDMSKGLHIKTCSELDEFHNKYSYMRGEALSDLLEGFIRWDNVIQEHDFVLITPYLWEARFGHLWYYGWDCASGVIFNPRCITKLGKPKSVGIPILLVFQLFRCEVRALRNDVWAEVKRIGKRLLYGS